jgi:hypothetical protein
VIKENGEIEYKEENVQLYKSELDNDTEINLLYNSNHYDIFYTKNYYEKYKTQLDIFKNNLNIETIFSQSNINSQLSEICRYFLKSNKKEKLSIHISNILNENKKLDELISQDNLKVDDLIDKIKKKICIQCFKVIKNNEAYYKLLPCGSIICSKECFDNFLTKKISKNENESPEEEKELEDANYFDHIFY